MKNLYISIPVLALALMASGTTSAQTAKPRAEKPTHRVRSVVPFGTPPHSALEYRGGGNDECASATMVTVTGECSGSLATYDAADATESQAAILCNGYTSPEAHDLWFSFVATNAITSVKVEGTASFDPVLEGFSGACGSLVSMGCADATFPEAGENTIETLTMATNVGSTYYVRVYSYWSPVPTDFGFTLCVYSVTNAPANDQCSGATAQALATGSSITFTGDNTDALDTEGLGNGSVWHAFTTTECSDVTLDYCGTDPAFGNALLSLFKSCPINGDDFVGASSFDATTCPDGNVTIRWSYLPAGTYYYAVIKDETSDPTAVGPYTVNVASAAIAAGYCEASNTEACDEFIAQVTIGTVDNTTECTEGVVADYTDQTVDIYQNETLAITVLNGPSFYAADAVGVWVDWNQNQSFCEENEYHALTSADAGVSFTGFVYAPTDALVGTTRMRVRMVYDMAPMACGVGDFGEIEDYTVNVLLGNSIAENSQLDWAVYPNPNTGDMTVRFGGKDAKVMIQLFDVAGRVAHQEQRQLFNGQQVNLGLAGKLAAGTYTLRLTSTEGRSEQRVVVQ